MIAPLYFSFLDAAGIAIASKSEITPDHMREVKEAAMECPTRAIAIIHDGSDSAPNDGGRSR
jgi:ferredoxin